MTKKTYKIGAKVPYCYSADYGRDGLWEVVAIYDTNFDGRRYDIRNGNVILRYDRAKEFYRAG